MFVRAQVDELQKELDRLKAITKAHMPGDVTELVCVLSVIGIPYLMYLAYAHVQARNKWAEEVNAKVRGYKVLARRTCG